MSTGALCTFYVDQSLFGLFVSDVQEVLRDQRCTPVPLAPQMIGGLINLRGQIVTAINFRARLGLTPLPSSDTTNVLMLHGNHARGIVVDAIGDIVEPSDDSYEDPPATLDISMKQVIRGVYKLPGTLLHLLDLPAVLSANPTF